MHNVNITVTRVSDYGKPQTIRLEIEDKTNRLPLISLEMEPSDFALAITGSLRQKGVLTHLIDKENIDNIGKKKITNILDIPYEKFDSENDLKKYLTKYYNDWVRTTINPSLDEGFKLHSYLVTSNRMYRAVFVRYEDY